MIHPEMAQRFVDRLCAKLPYNINIMNDRGLIIASRDPERRGTYHEVAHRICLERMPSVIVDDTLPLPQGTLPGINLAVEHNGETIGVVGITGKPGDVGILSETVKTAIETMVEHELFKERVARRQDRKKLLLSMLLYGNREDVAEARVLASHLGYDPERPRIPLLIPCKDPSERAELLKAIKESELHTRQDISMELHDGKLLLFKALSLPVEQMIAAIRRQIEAYLRGVANQCRAVGLALPDGVYCGTLQRHFEDYRRAFGHALWLQEHVDSRRFSTLCFFYDFFYEYLVSLLPEQELKGILDVFLGRIEPKTLTTFRETIRSYVRHNASLKETAAALGIHRNTVLQRLQRVQQTLGIDPLHDEYQRSILFAFFGTVPELDVHGAHQEIGITEP